MSSNTKRVMVQVPEAEYRRVRALADMAGVGTARPSQSAVVLELMRRGLDAVEREHGVVLVPPIARAA